MAKKPRRVNPQAVDRLATTIHRFEEATKELSVEQRTALLCELLDEYIINHHPMAVNPPAFFGDK